MKTLEEVQAHLNSTIYDEYSKERIAAFIAREEMKKGIEYVGLDFAIPKNFDYFKEWFDESEEEHPKAKVYQDGKWFDITFDEICGNLKKYNPVICDGVMPDDILTKTFDELGIGYNESKNNSNKSIVYYRLYGIG